MDKRIHWGDHYVMKGDMPNLVANGLGFLTVAGFIPVKNKIWDALRHKAVGVGLLAYGL